MPYCTHNHHRKQTPKVIEGVGTQRKQCIDAFQIYSSIDSNEKLSVVMIVQTFT